jgi:hypothetical protein
VNAPVDVLAVMARHPNIRPGFTTGMVGSLLQTAGGLVRSPSGNSRFPPRPLTRDVLKELRRLEAAGDVQCIGRRSDFDPFAGRGNAAAQREFLWLPTPAALARVQP